jgi:hypothetical protein
MRSPQPNEELRQAKRREGRLRFKIGARGAGMFKVIVYGLMGMLLAVPMVNVVVQVNSSTRLSVSAEEIKTPAKRRSAKKYFLDKPVYNEKDERIGEIDDIIISVDDSSASAILNVGGFLGIGEHRVAIPFDRFTVGHGRIVLPGATKETLNEIPPFDHP